MTLRKRLGALLGRDQPHPTFYHEVVLGAPDKFGRVPWAARVYARAASGPLVVTQGHAASPAEAQAAARAAAEAALKAQEATWR